MDTGRAELHFHALPGLDDGPDTLEESVQLVRLAEADGAAIVVATPHVRTDFVTDVIDLPERTRELQCAVRAAGLAVEVVTGGELGHDMVGRLSQAELELIAQGPARARWLLVETPFDAPAEELHAATDELRDRGFGILLAHPERSGDAALYGAAALRGELAAGALAQINAGSVTGRHGSESREAALRLLDEDLAAVIGSDAHGPARPPLLGEAGARLLELGFPVGLCRELIGAGPHRLLARGIPAGALV